MTIKKFQRIILDHYKLHGRTMPWRNTQDPYKILVSEIMLQQTQVSRVLPKYKEFLQEFPTIQALAAAPQATLLTVWRGLGYWRRAQFLQKTAQVITIEHGGEFPKQPKELQKLPGVGPYTAGALACFAFNHTAPFIDTNIRRVYLHFFFEGKQNIADKKILDIAHQALYTQDPRVWHYALFDYGAMQLKNKRINRASRHYNKQSTFKGSFRSFRAKAVKFLLDQPRHQVSHTSLQEFLLNETKRQNTMYTPDDIIAALVKDKLITKTSRRYEL